MYIATQGPIVSTVGDFWHMVWQEHTPIIVMITNIEEMNEVGTSAPAPGVRSSGPTLSLVFSFSQQSCEVGPVQSAGKVREYEAQRG